MPLAYLRALKVTAGGVPLTENTDYIVDYNMGTVTIINSALIESQTPIQVSLENNQFFGFQTKTLLGTHLDYKLSDKLDIGGTILHLNETPYTQKVNYGEEPISNTIWGLNTSYKTESQLLTKMIDKIPLLNTKLHHQSLFSASLQTLYLGTLRRFQAQGIHTLTILKRAKYHLTLNHLMHGASPVFLRDRTIFFLKRSLIIIL